MSEPGLDRHEWESEWESIEEGIHDDPVDAVAELDMLVHRMLEESGFDIDDPVEREGDEREVVANFLAAREIKLAIDRESDDISSGDVAAAINNYRDVYEYLIATRSTS
jgi:predicted type IV restriction endonuclease